MKRGRSTILNDMKPPDDLDWQYWVDRWDRMQEQYIVKRSERFEVIKRLIRSTQQPITKIVDLGCGTGSLMLSVLESFPDAEVLGYDFDPTLLWLARARLSTYSSRSKIELVDLREPSWSLSIPFPDDAVISATALHWLNPDQLNGLYMEITNILKSGGIFLNADHVGSELSEIQQEWEDHRAQMLKKEDDHKTDGWEMYWTEYSKALGLDVKEIHQRVVGGWEGGVEKRAAPFIAF